MRGLGILRYTDRLTALRAQIKDQELSGLLILDPKNRQYLTGFDGSSGWLLVTPKEHFLLSDGRYWDQVARQCPRAKLVRFIPAEHGTLSGALLTVLPPGILGIETDGLALSLYRELIQALERSGFSYEELEGVVRNLRECKDEDEIACLKKAAEIADFALNRALRDFAPGQSELDLKAAIEYQILKFGGYSTSFSTIVASGPNGSYPHAGASERLVGEGEMITVDFGAVYRGYCSDMTRTIWYGRLSERDRNLLHHTREAQKLALESVIPGLKASALDSVARERLREADLDTFFVHSLGHGVGLEVHEQPGIRSTNEAPLKPGQVITIEPGVYLPGQAGCRVEDTVLVTSEGCQILNSFPKQPLDAERPPQLEIENP